MHVEPSEETGRQPALDKAGHSTLFNTDPVAAFPSIETFMEEKINPLLPASELRKNLEHIHWALHGLSIVARTKEGHIVVIQLADQVLVDKGILSAIPDEEMQELFRPHIPRLCVVLENHRSDYDSGARRLESVSWWAAHNLFHLRKHGGREYVRERLGLDIEKIERTLAQNS